MAFNRRFEYAATRAQRIFCRRLRGAHSNRKTLMNRQTPDISSLERLCRRHILPPDHAAVVPEPYLPFIPPKWNGVLVTAEAQNLSAKNEEYRSWLIKLSRTKRIRRLSERTPVAVAPWSDGTLQIAVEAALGVRADQTAVSNAVPWSLVAESGSNANPSEELAVLATAFWAVILPAMKPKVLVACGKIGRMVFSGDTLAGVKGLKTHFLSLPSSSLLSRVSGLFSDYDLLGRYPEVKSVVDRRPDLVASYRRNKIFFACHSVSVIKGRNGS